MNQDWISALAREYAEELSPDNKVEREMIELDCLGFLDRVLNSYCLVEKGKVGDIYKNIYVQLDPKSFGYSPYNQGRMSVIKSLFPEITKEVEG